MPFLSLLSAAATNLITWPEPGVYARLQLEVFSVRQRQVVETHFHLPFRRKVCLQLSGSALASGDRPDLRDLTI